jgi:enolase
MPTIKNLTAMEILDSRGRPTVQATCEFTDSVRATASIPSGASTGKAEALELRDGDKARYLGRGCRKAVSNINHAVASAVRGKDFERQENLDKLMVELDGTENKSRLGANALLAVSIAFARAQALQLKRPLYQHFAAILGRPAATLPRMTINLFSGGKHAGGQVDIQDVLVVPMSAKTIDEGLAMTYAVYQAAAAIGLQRYNMRALTADEGGLAPPFTCAQAMLDDAVSAIEAAGLKPGTDVKIAVDVASSHFYEGGRYKLDGDNLDGNGMIERLAGWVKHYPIISVEDGLSEEDWPHWPQLRKAIGDRVLVLGDDLLCTNPARIKRAIETKSASALLLKVNQIGTLTEAAVACRLAQDAKWAVTISARSGETEDNWLADLAVGWSGNQIKVGSIAHSERLAKYNRLLEIEAETRFPISDFGLRNAD